MCIFNLNDVCRLTVSKELGDVIYDHYAKDSSCSTYLELLSLSHDVYSDVGAHVDAMKCFVKQNLINSVIQYAISTQDCMSQHLIEVFNH